MKSLRGNILTDEGNERALPAVNKIVASVKFF